MRQYFGDGADLGVSLAYATEESPLGTAGSVKNAEGALDETFLVVSGDALTDIDLEKVTAYHREKGALVTVVLSRQPNPLEYGIVIADDEGRIERFLEKPGWGQVFSDTVNTGIAAVSPHALFDWGTAIAEASGTFSQFLSGGSSTQGALSAYSEITSTKSARGTPTSRSSGRSS